MQSRGDPPSQSLHTVPPGIPTTRRSHHWVSGADTPTARHFPPPYPPIIDETTRLRAKNSHCLGLFPTISFHEAPETIYLGWHHFCIGSSNFHTSIKARSVVGLHNVSAVGFVCPYPAVVRTCNGTGEQQREHEFPGRKRLKFSENQAHTQGRTLQRLGTCQKAPKSVSHGSATRVERQHQASPSESLSLCSVTLGKS